MRTVVVSVVGGVCAFLLACIGATWIVVEFGPPQGPSKRTQCKSNLRQIGLALHEYAKVHGSFPPAYVADANGKPMHSWRVLILPYIDQQARYNAYNFAEPWDGPNNSRLLANMPILYACPGRSRESTNTSYVAPIGTHCIFRGAEPVALDDIPDGASMTVLVGETLGADIPWMKPEDIDIAVHPALGDKQGFSSPHNGIVNFLLADISIISVKATVDPQTLQALFTRDGGETVGDY